MKDLFDIAERSQPGERQTDIELIIEEKKEMKKEIEYKPVDGCEECEFAGCACPECIMYGEAEKVEKADPNGICSEPEDDGNLAWAENYSGPGLGGWQG